MTGVVIRTVGAVTSIVLGRPDEGNSLTLAVAESLREAVVHVQDTLPPDTRAIVLRATGKRFCVGGDLAAFASAPAGAGLNETVARPLHDVIELFGQLPVPVIAAVQGATGGGGVGLVLACDLAVAAEGAFFRLGYTGSGLSPDCGVTWELPHRVGTAVAADLLLTNRKVPAAEALSLGLVSRVVADDRLDAEVESIAEALCTIPPATVTETKRLLRAAVGRSRHEQLKDEAVTIGRIGDTAASREAMTAFLERRKLRFGGAR